MTKIVAVADLHGHLPEIPECDILVVAGDVCPIENHQHHFQRNWLNRRFSDWLNEVPAKDIIGVAGNHDFVLEADTRLGYELPWHYLKDSGIEVQGIKFYGYPWVPNLSRWAFYADDATLWQKAKAIPDDLDILVTHGPPQGIRDAVSWCEHVGDKNLVHRLFHPHRGQPHTHIFGHIHEGYGTSKENGIEFVGASIMNQNYNPVNKPHLLWQ